MKRKKRNIPEELLSPEAQALESKLSRRRIGTGPVVEPPPVIAVSAAKMPLSPQVNKAKLEINFLLEKFLSDQLTLNGQTKRHFILFCEVNRLPIDEDGLLKFMVRHHFPALSEISIEKVFYNPGKGQEFLQQMAPLSSIFNNINASTISVDIMCDAGFNLQILTREDLSLNRKRLTHERFSEEYNIHSCLQKEKPLSYREVMTAWLKQLMAQYCFLNHKSQVRESLHLSGYAIEEILKKAEGFLNEELSPALSKEDLSFLKESLEEIVFDQNNIELLTDIGTKGYFRMEEENIAKIIELITRIKTVLSPVQNGEDLKENLFVAAVVENDENKKLILNYIPFKEDRNVEKCEKKSDVPRGIVFSARMSFFFDETLIFEPRLDLDRDSAYQYIFMLTLSALDPSQFTLTSEVEGLIALSKNCLAKIKDNEDINKKYTILSRFINQNKEGFFRQRLRDILFYSHFPKMDNNRLLCDYLHEKRGSVRNLRNCLYHIVGRPAFFGVLNEEAVVDKIKNQMSPVMWENIKAMECENDSFMCLMKSASVLPSALGTDATEGVFSWR